jgi:hypothetical protein
LFQRLLLIFGHDASAASGKRSPEVHRNSDAEEGREQLVCFPVEGERKLWLVVVYVLSAAFVAVERTLAEYWIPRYAMG